MGLHLRDLPYWPAALDVIEAIAYSRLSETEIRRQINAGKLVFKARGHNGKKVCLRAQLDDVLQTIWSDGVGIPLDPSEDLDFGDD